VDFTANTAIVKPRLINTYLHALTSLIKIFILSLSSIGFYHFVVDAHTMLNNG